MTGTTRRLSATPPSRLTDAELADQLATVAHLSKRERALKNEKARRADLITSESPIAR